MALLTAALTIPCLTAISFLHTHEFIGLVNQIYFADRIANVLFVRLLVVAYTCLFIEYIHVRTRSMQFLSTRVGYPFLCVLV